MTEIVEADECVMKFMKAQVKERKAELGSSVTSNHRKAEADAFTMLVEANENEDKGKSKLDDEELVR